MLAGHGVFDIKHFRMLTNPNLPIWLAILLIGFDILKSATGKWWETMALVDKLAGLRSAGGSSLMTKMLVVNSA